MTDKDTESPPAGATPNDIAPERIDSASLFKNAREIVVVHNGEPYRLRVTSKGKLILTK